MPVILTAKESFHGRTMATLSATGTSKVQAGFSPLRSEFIHVDFDDVEAIKQYSDNKNIVAVMLEPIQGEAGVIIPQKDYLNEVNAVCEENDWLFILDEVNRGIRSLGRASRWWLHNSLKNLNKRLENKISFYLGDPLKILGDLVKKFEIKNVFWNRCYEPWRIERDTQIKSYFNKKNIKTWSIIGSRATLGLFSLELIKKNLPVTFFHKNSLNLEKMINAFFHPC